MSDNKKLKQALISITALWVGIGIVFFSGMAPAAEKKSSEFIKEFCKETAVLQITILSVRVQGAQEYQIKEQILKLESLVAPDMRLYLVDNSYTEFPKALIAPMTLVDFDAMQEKVGKIFYNECLGYLYES